MRSLIALITLIFSISCGTATAATAADMENLKHVVTNQSVVVFSRHRDFVADMPNDTVVWHCHESRISVTYDSSINRLIFHVEKTRDTGLIDTFYDSHLDGTVDGGIGANIIKEFDTGLITSTGDEYRDYWQQYLDETVESILGCQ